MFTLTELSREFYDKNLQAKILLAEVIEELPLAPSEVRFNPEERILAEASTWNNLYFIKNGVIKVEEPEKLLFFLEAGDLIGVGDFYRTPNTIVHSEYPVVLDRYGREEFLDAVLAGADLRRKWLNYIEMVLTLFKLMAASLTKKELKVELSTKSFQAGEPIIIQDTQPAEVYTLLNGIADVFVGSKKVGEVLTGEIFGAMAATAHTRRTASVIARSDCLALALPKEHFLALAETHPETVFKLIEDMSRIIISQNMKLIEDC